MSDFLSDRRRAIRRCDTIARYSGRPIRHRSGRVQHSGTPELRTHSAPQSRAESAPAETPRRHRVTTRLLCSTPPRRDPSASPDPLPSCGNTTPASFLPHPHPHPRPVPPPARQPIDKVRAIFRPGMMTSPRREIPPPSPPPVGFSPLPAPAALLTSLSPRPPPPLPSTCSSVPLGALCVRPRRNDIWTGDTSPSPLAVSLCPPPSLPSLPSLSLSSSLSPSWKTIRPSTSSRHRFCRN